MLLTLLVLAAAPVDLKELEDPKPAVRYAAARKFSEEGEAAAVPVLTKALESPRPLLREMAAYALGRFGAEESGKVAFGALPKLEKMITSDPEVKVRKAASNAVGFIAREAPAAEKKKATAALALGLKDADGEVRSSAAMALAALDPSSADAAAELGAAMQRPEPPGSNLHQEACFRLEVMGAAAKRGVPGLVHLLKGDDPDLRASAIDAITKLGPVAIEAAPALEALGATAALKAVRAKK